MLKIAVFVSGGGTDLQSIIDACQKGEINVDIRLVISNRKSAYGLERARNAGIRVIRDNIVIHDGKLISLKRFKDDVKEVGTSYECGLQIENFNDIAEGDQLEVYVMEEVK